jgi:DNA-binding transcriptional ArsR family regulator
VNEVLDRLVPLRAKILEGDLRPLYLAHLALMCDAEHDPEETTEGPVAAGLGNLTAVQRALAELFGLSDALIAAAAEGNPEQPVQGDTGKLYAGWLQSLPQATKDAWLLEWLADAHSSARSDLLAEFRKSRPLAAWPTSQRDRTIAELETAAEDIHKKAVRKATEKAAKKRAKRLAGMAADPAPTRRETERLVKLRSRESYVAIATLLKELREALAGTKQAGLAEQQAQKLKKENPTLNLLTSELRRAGLVTKGGEVF